MTLSTTERDLLAKRSELSETEQMIVQTTLEDMDFRAGLVGLTLAKDDSAAKLEAAMIQYILDSREQGQ